MLKGYSPVRESAERISRARISGSPKRIVREVHCAIYQFLPALLVSKDDVASSCNRRLNHAIWKISALAISNFGVSGRPAKASAISEWDFRCEAEEILQAGDR
jgi:hypothetical protein